MKLENLAGQKFDLLTVLSRVADKNGAVRWLCQCKCGKTKEVYACSLKSRSTKTCGSTECRRIVYPRRNPAKTHVLYNYKSNAKDRKIAWELSDETFYRLTQQNCRYCGTPPMTERRADGWVYVYNGVDRVVNELGYTEENAVSCCQVCNYAKRTLSEYQFLNWVTKVYHHSAKSIEGKRAIAKSFSA